MKKYQILSALLIVAATGNLATTALAAQTMRTDQFGSPASIDRAQRTVQINGRYVNVVQGETVTFVTSQGESFTWNFDSWNEGVVPLANIAPNNFRAGNVVVYVGRNPIYSGSR